MLAGDVFEQAVYGSQALIARADVVATLGFEVLEKADDPLEGEIAKRETRDLAAPVGG